MNSVRFIIISLVVLLLPVSVDARWSPDRLPTVSDVAAVIKHVLSQYDDGRCRSRIHRRKHPNRCVRTDEGWKQAQRGVWRWHNDDFREEYYSDSKLQWYAAGIINALEQTQLDDNFNYYVSLVMEALRQSKFYPRAWSRYNRDKDGNFIRFNQPWCDGKGSLLHRLGKICGGKLCDTALDLFEHGTDEAKRIFRKRCDWADRKGGDGGAYQMHMSTLARVSRRHGFRASVHKILGHNEPWHYTMSQHFWISALAGAHWQKKQASWEGCGRWMAKRYSHGQIRRLGKTNPRSATYSCFKLQFCNGTPMKVGNPVNACREARFVRQSFQHVMETDPDQLM